MSESLGPRPWLNATATAAVFDALEAKGGAGCARVVGGAVRNAVIGAPVGDIDIATDARPDRVIALARAAGLKPVPTGQDHGTITVVADHQGHEVTTFRQDIETDGRHARVIFGDSVEADARRRDFTMNAIYADPEGQVIDPLAGLSDLQARHVRFIGAPDRRITEDYLRILRFFRFHAWYGDPRNGLDPDGLAAAAAQADGLAQLSRERIGAEMLKLLAAPDPAPSVAAMRVVGILTAVLPGTDDRALAPLAHVEGLAGAPPDAIRRLAALGGGPDVARRLRLSRVQAQQLMRLRDAAVTTAGAAELGYRHGTEAGRDIVLLRAALTQQPPGAQMQAQLARGAAAQCPVRAADLMPGLSGPELGQRLQEIESRWIASGFTLTRDELL